MTSTSDEERYIREQVEYLRGYYKNRDKDIEDRRKARDGDDFTKEDVPEAYRSTAQVVNIKRNADVLQRTQAIVTDDDPAWEVPPISEEDSDKRNASHRERFLAAAIDRIVDESGRDAIRMALDSALANGMGILKLTYLPDAWKDEPDREYEEEEEQDGKVVKVRKEKDAAEYTKEVKAFRQSAPFPFLLEDVDVLTYYPVPARKVREVYEISSRPILPTLEAFNATVTKEGSKRVYRKLPLGEKFPTRGGLGDSDNAHEMVECIERWRENEVIYYIDCQEVDRIKHNYGFLNYVELAGYQTSSREPGKAIRSVIDGQRELIRELRRVLTIWLNWAYLAGWPFIEGPEDGGSLGAGIPDDTANVTQLVPGTILKHGTKFVEPPQAGKDLGALAQIFQAEADRAGLASVMYGSASGISSGYMGSDLRAAAMSVLKPIIRNGGRAIGRVGQMMQMLIDRRVKDTVYVYGAADKDKGGKEWLSLGPRDIKGYYPVKATIRPLMPLDEIGQRDSAIRMHEAGLWDPETALERTGENQPERILDRVWAYKYMAESGLNTELGERAALKAGLIEEQKPAPTIYGPGGQVLSGGPEGIGGNGIPAQGPVGPMIPGDNLPLVPPAPMNPAQPNMPYVPRSPGVAAQPPMQVP